MSKYIIPHHLKGVKYYNQNIKKRLTYLKLVVFSVQYSNRARILLLLKDFCGNGSQEKGVALKVKYYKITKRAYTRTTFIVYLFFTRL